MKTKPRFNALEHLQHTLQSKDFHPVIPANYSPDNVVVLDLSKHNTALQQVNLANTEAFSDYIFNEVLRGKLGVGGYAENRYVYTRSPHYAGAEPRSVHLGIDIWVPAHTPVHAPLDGLVYGFADNQGFGNYGPTIILQHQLNNITFFTLYGHLSRRNLRGLEKKQWVREGEVIGDVGNYPENGDWPPHLHFQVMNAMLGNISDFPGVAAPSDRQRYLSVCPDPNFILAIPSLF